MVATAALRKLISTLRGTAVSPDASESLLYVTTIVMSTEFDRKVNRYPQDLASPPGTNHGATVSLFMAGYRVNSGKIVGGRGTGPDGQVGGLGAANNFNGPLPIDLNTGIPSSSGTTVDNGGIQPAILRMWSIL